MLTAIGAIWLFAVHQILMNLHFQFARLISFQHELAINTHTDTETQADIEIIQFIGRIMHPTAGERVSEEERETVANVLTSVLHMRISWILVGKRKLNVLPAQLKSRVCYIK